MTDEEWVEWQEKFLVTKPTTKAEKDELSGLTGRIPLYLKYWNQEVKDKENDTFETVRDRFDETSGVDIDANLLDFTGEVNNTKRHIALMMAAIGGLKATPDYSLFHQGYFYGLES